MTLQELFKAITYFNHKSIYFNFKYFPFRHAIRFPVFVSFRTKLISAKGSIQINGPIKTGMIRIGYGEVGIFDKKYHRVLWEVRGTIVFNGGALFKFGSRVSVAENAELRIGDGFRISPDSSVICYKKVSIGNNVRISWETILMDNDFHLIKTMDGKLLNPTSDIKIGDDVWIGMRTTILKGSKVGNQVIIGSGTLLNKAIPGSNQVIAGNPARVIKKGVLWEP